MKGWIDGEDTVRFRPHAVRWNEYKERVERERRRHFVESLLCIGIAIGIVLWVIAGYPTT